MALTTEIVEYDYQPGSANAPEAIPFQFLSADDIVVTHEAAADGARTVLTIVTDYTIAGDGMALSGTITSVGDWPAGDKFLLRRTTPIKQDAAIVAHQALPTKDVVRQLDRQAMGLQEQGRDIADTRERALMVPEGEEALELGSLAGADGQVIGKVGGKLVLVPNDAATAAVLKAEVEALKADVQATADDVEADKLATAADRALAAGHEFDAQAAATAAADYAANALASLQAALAAGRVYNDDTEAFTNTTDGQNLFLREDGNFVEYINDDDTDLIATGIVVAGAATLLATASAVEAAAALVGLDTGNGGALGGIGGVEANGYSRRMGMYIDVPARAAVANEFISAPRMRARKTTTMWMHSMGAGSGVVGAGAAVKPTSGIAGSLGRKLEQHLKQADPTHSVANRSQSAQKSQEIAMRMGAIPVTITLDSGTTLGAASVAACKTGTATTGQNGPSAQRNNSPDVYAGFIYGQACLLKAVDNASSNPKEYTIEQVGGTGDITILPRTPFWIVPPADSRHGVNLLWPTQNDNDDVQMSKDMVRAMVQSLPQDERRYVVMGEIPFATSEDGLTGTAPEDATTARWANRMAKNAWMREQFFGNYFDVYAFLRGDAPYDGTIYPSVFHLSGEDRDQAANDYSSAGDWKTKGLIPKRWMSVNLGGADWSHLHEQTNWWLSKGLIEIFYRPKGWL